MKVIEKGKFTEEKLSIQDLRKVNGGFCKDYTVCTQVGTSCGTKVYGSKICFNKTVCSQVQ